MKTRISAFCDEYENLLIPIDELIESAIKRIERESRRDLLEDPLTRLSDSGHRFHSLREKIEHQQAYLIIFGPLKSGKSTLMNAISGTYVSEVTAMPAYPCLVYVSDGEETGFTAIKYNGTSEEFTDSDGLRDVLDESHSHLAGRIRMHELEGEEFDPSIHYTEAVRRIDVRTPVPALREANTVLVDTPGLYSRMKFGYGLMTREFRDSAACAVFVVKSDNLFLDQVFSEFTELLDVFSRIFLVVNIDTGKQDLRPDGSLGPSIESSDPARIIEAFKSLAMTAPLREAHEAGRLQIYPIDLLNAAVGSLSHGERAAEASFDSFLSDLAEYLNSNDYLCEFERDSLKQGASICAGVREACDLSTNEAFQEQLSELRRIGEELPSQIDAVEEASASDMTNAFERSRSRCLESVDQSAKRTREELRIQMREALNTWTGNDESLHDLLQHWNRMIEQACDPVTSALPHALASHFDTPTGGAEFDLSLIQQLQKVQLDLEIFARPFVANLKELPIPVWEPLQLDPDRISVSRSFLDRLLFRSMQKIRGRLFGPADAPDRPIAPAMKRKRLAEHGVGELHAVIDDFLGNSFPEPQCRYVGKHADEFISQFTSAFQKELESVKSELVGHMESNAARIAADDRILEAVDRLNEEIAAVEERISAMKESHLAQTDEKPDEAPDVEQIGSANDEIGEAPSEIESEERFPLAEFPIIETEFVSTDG